jgi:hypothetical protein
MITTVVVSLSSQSDLDMPYEFSSTAFFKLTPSAGVLRPHQSTAIVVTFSPAQLGKFNKKVVLSIGKGIRTEEMKLSAEASSLGPPKTLTGGIDKLPDDFKRVLTFVEPGAAAATKRSTAKFQRELPWNRSEFLSSLSWNEENLGKDDKSFSYDANGPVTFSRQTLERRANHRQKYTDFLNESRRNRHPESLLEKNDRGLTEPHLSLPPAPEKLWMLYSGDDSSKTNALLADEDKLVVKKYPFTPQTQSEMKDCAVELSAEDYKLIVPSHKILNFGKVSLTSVSAKSFTVVNNRVHPVLVRITDLDKDMRESTPVSQVIPGRGVAGFDVSVSMYTFIYISL